MILHFILTLTALLFPLNSFADQNITLEIPEISSNLLNIVGLITVLSIAPSILIMTTSFTRIIVILSILRSALGLQQSPPNMVITSLAMFLTLFVMLPTFQNSYNDGIEPLLNEEISEIEAVENISKHFHKFMIHQVREEDVSAFAEIAKIDINLIQTPDNIPFRVLLPAFMISELRRAFEMGFLIFLPFLVIDLLVSSILMAMGMMMLPPVMVSLPFKVIFFVLIDGWRLISGALVKSFII